MSPNAEYWVAEVDGVVVGGCGFYPTEGLPDLCAEVVKFYLSPLARGRRIGSQLFDLIEERAIKAGYKQLYVESFKIFSQAVSLYEKRGYKYLSAPLVNVALFSIYHFFTPWENITRIVALIPMVYGVWYTKNIRIGIIIHMALNVGSMVMMMIAVFK